jgi:plastocyanin
LVPRRVNRAFAFLAAAGAALILSAVLVAPAQAVNTRVSIENFQWSKNAEVDLGESVTWDWIGPDTQHSVTGQPNNATQWDSDPGNVGPHPLGDTFTVTFDQPGVYNFVCKLHASVRGSVTVSGNPGEPGSDPGPQAPLNLDLIPPNFTGAYLNQTSMGPKGNGTGMNFGINEKSTITVDYYELIKKRSGKWKRKFAGYGEWNAHVGNNTINFAKRTENFAAKPARYVGLTYATDESVNSSPTSKLKFTINKKKKKK